MSGTKAALKAAKQAIDSEQWAEAETQAQSALAADPQNYFAKLFLGRALEKQGKLDQAATVYHSAAQIRPEDTQAWLGLCSLYEGLGSKRVDEYGECAVKVAVLYGQADDIHKCQSAIDKLTSFAKANGTSAQYKRALQVTLPGSPVYGFLEGRLPQPALTLSRIAELTERDEKQLINKEIGERRTRLGARVAQVTEDVKREVYAKSDLEDLYRSIIDWTLDDEVRIAYEEKLLERAYDNLCVLREKDAKRQQVVDLSRGMVIVKRPCRLAWDIYLEWFDAATMSAFDVNVLREYVEFFPSSSLSKTLRAFLDSEISPFPTLEKPESEAGGVALGDEQTDDDPVLSQQERLLLMSESLGEGQGSPLAHRIVGEYYLHLEEFESAIETTRNGLALIGTEETKAGFLLPDNRDALNSVLATALVHYQAPRHHAEADRLLKDILQRKPKSTSALIGLGLIHEEQEEYAEAISLLDQALEQDSENLQIGTETAWCRALLGDEPSALDMLEKYLPKIRTDTPRLRDLRAQTLYRIGRCMWSLDSSSSARKDRNGAYARFLSAIKTNVNFAPAYTSLGFFYGDHARDKKRARQCFQKAFELSSSEVEAAERLARAFAEKKEWDIVESIAQRVIDSGRVRPPPGSKKKGISWPFSALGVVQMTKLEYSKAVTSFLSALKIRPDDYNSYVGLGESYHNSGRYNSASRTFHYAENPPAHLNIRGGGEKWFTKYMLANVHRELGEYEEAIAALEGVLVDRPDEFGVLIALLQTLVENAWRCVVTGSFGQAAENAASALRLGEKIAVIQPTAFNLWKAVGDACSIFFWTQAKRDKIDVSALTRLMIRDATPETYGCLTDVDGVGLQSLQTGEDSATSDMVARMSVLAYKRAIHSCAEDLHAQAVAWYNLGWAEYRAHTKTRNTKTGKRYLKASVRCFKRSIELEAGNSEFWNSLGVVTSQLNPKVAQHAFVRSLNLNEHSARTWTNLGALYLINNDFELAHEAFARAQSTDPEYAHAWVGEGLIAQMLGNEKEALSHFTHGFEISDASSLIAKRRYALSMFDRFSADSSSGHVTRLLQPLFVIQQLRVQDPDDIAFSHLGALMSERVGDHGAAIKVLETVCETLENEFETTESQSTLMQFAHAKADLARDQLGVEDFEAAAENAQTALDLLSDAQEDASGIAIDKIRSSAYSTIGLSRFHQGDTAAAVEALASALNVKSDPEIDPEAVCVLARVLWATGGDKERRAAKTQLDECIKSRSTRQKSHVASIVLRAVIAVLEDDSDTSSASRQTLANLVSTSDELSVSERTGVQSVLSYMAALADTKINKSISAERAQTLKWIMLRPFGSAEWKSLVQSGSDEKVRRHAAGMALLNARRSVPPYSNLMGAEDLALTFADTGVVDDSKTAVVLAPWLQKGWEGVAAEVRG